MTATARLLSQNRLHLQHGPIDLIIGADGASNEIERAYRAAADAFPSILPGLVSELPLLRAAVTSAPYLHSPIDDEGRDGLSDPVATRMCAAVWPYRDQFITPMAAVAGSVADHVLAVMCAAACFDRVYVNNGGDIAIYLKDTAAFTVGVVGDLAAPGIDAKIIIGRADCIGGIATSGWRGRSQSLGIADAVTVLARSAAAADAAATMIANAVNVEDSAVQRRPAHEVKDESDLGNLAVTVGVGRLTSPQRSLAIANGVGRAQEFLAKKLIVAAYIQLQGATAVAGLPTARLKAT